MNGVGAWVLCILGIVVLGIVLDLLMANTRLHKIIQTVFATVTILVVITPIPGLIKSGFNPGSSIFDKQIELDQSYLEYVRNTKCKMLGKGVEDALAQDGFKNTIVTVSAEIEKDITITSVRINLKKLVIDKDYLHINKYEYVREKVSKYLNISKELVFVYDE